MSQQPNNPSSIDPEIEDIQKSSHPNSRHVGRLRPLFVAILAALSLNALLLFAIGDLGPFGGLRAFLFGANSSGHAFAAPLAEDSASTATVDHVQSNLHLGIVITRPDGNAGEWVITDSSPSGYAAFISTESTHVDEGIAVSDCVQIETRELTPTVAINISKQDALKCNGSGDGGGGSGGGDDGGGGGDSGGDNGGGDNGGDAGHINEVFGTIESRPPEKAGTWVISATAYTVISQTIVSGEVMVGDCAEVRTNSNEPMVALTISGQSPSHCPSDSGGGDDQNGGGSGGNDGGSSGGGDGSTSGGGGDNGDQQLIDAFGFVIHRPIEKVGSWGISATTYSVLRGTIVSGEIVEGDCVEVRSSVNTPTVAIKIIERDAWKCGSGQNDESNNYQHEWEGIVLTYPVTLQGEWKISVGENQLFTFTTNGESLLNPDSPSSYGVGKWVEVRVIRKTDGSYVAERVRVDDHELGEIVVRLDSSAYSYTIASKYNLVLQSTLLTNANIFLYITNSEHEQALATEISHEHGVIWAEVNYINNVPEDDGYKTWGWGGKSEPDQYTDQAAYQQIRLGQGSRQYTGEGAVVAILDTGIYTAHEQFVGKLKLPSLDVIDDDSDPSEVGPGLAWGHGTHVAGIISAIAPAAKLLPVRVLDQNGRGNTFLLAYAIEWVTKQPGVKVINLSLGADGDSQILHDAIENAIAQGIIVVAAAGNDDSGQVQYPAGYENVIGVTAIDSNSKKASFANYGRDWVDVSAPGVGIMSTMISEDGPGYASWSGTSMATAFVSGAAALVAQKFDTQAHSASVVENQLTQTGLVLDGDNPQYAGEMGRLLDVSAALKVAPPLVFVPVAAK